MSRLFARAMAARGPCVLLEGTGGTGPLARRTLFAHSPIAVAVAGAAQTAVRRPAGREVVREPWADTVRRLLREVRPGRWPDEGGVVGALAYDAARPGPGAPTPRLLAMAVDRFAVEEDGRLVGPEAEADTPWAEEAPAPAPPGPPPPEAPLHLPAWSSLDEAGHRALVLRAQEHIARGDIYQANLSQRFRMPWTAGGLKLYAALRAVSPAPFSGYLRLCGLEIASASPERLGRVADGTVTTRPIAGTRPRSLDAAADQALRAELLLSEKERAEHLMLVDLARNDVGRVAEIGSVVVDELMTVEDYAQVRHIVSNVRARLAPGRDALDALVALFPGGTITGVPKHRCMQILDVLEPVPRGFYTGALFYVTPSGRLDANILIRSAVVCSGTVTFHAGGGIVADSDPALEYQETLHKAEGIRLALEAVLTGR